MGARPLLTAILALLALLGLAVVSAFADDLIVLKSGRRARGKIVEETEAGVKLEVSGGTLFYARSQIEEVVRNARPTIAGDAPKEPARELVRRDHAVLYEGDRRVGTRSFTLWKQKDGAFQLEEDLVWLDAAGAEKSAVRTVEHAGPSFEPRSLRVRRSGEAGHELMEGTVAAGTLMLRIKKGALDERVKVVLPTSARFSLAAREMFARETRALAGRMDTHVFSPKDRRFLPTRYREAGRRKVPREAQVVEVRIFERITGPKTRTEWVTPDHATHLILFADGERRALYANAGEVARVRAGTVEEVTGADSAKRSEYRDARRGWSIRKPDPSWTFEKPAVQGGGALLVVRSAPISASVDVFVDPAPVKNTTLERAAEALQRLCRSVAADFRVEREGYVRDGPQPYYWLEATATTKGEKTRTLARVIVDGEQVYRLLGACPAKWFDGARTDLDKILSSFSPR